LLPSKGKLLHSLQDPGYSKSSAPKALGSKAQRFAQDETEKGIMKRKQRYKNLLCHSMDPQD
jgi:hypothetical protein